MPKLVNAKNKPTEDVLSTLDKKWQKQVHELSRLIKNKFISMADMHLCEMWDFLAKNQKYIDSDVHKRICDTLNKICEILWSPAVTWGDFKPKAIQLESLLLQK